MRRYVHTLVRSFDNKREQNVFSLFAPTTTVAQQPWKPSNSKKDIIVELDRSLPFRDFMTAIAVRLFSMSSSRRIKCDGEQSKKD
jgi:hypothetical protein